MLENLRTFVFREAGDSEADRLALLRHLAPRAYFERSYRFDELRNLVSNDAGSEYVSSDPFKGEIGSGGALGPPVADPLHCITVQRYDEDGYHEPPYATLKRAAGHWRDVQADAVDPDYDGILRHAYIEPQHLPDWTAAAQRWRQSRVVVGRNSGATGKQQNSTKEPRRNLLSPVIDLARSRCRDPNDTAEVWAELQVLAEKRESPLLGVTDDGVQYLKNGAVAYLNRDALRKRLHPEKRTAPAKRR